MERPKHTNSKNLHWLAFALLIVTVFFVFSSYDFSFILTLAVGLQCFGFAMVYITTQRTGDLSGISWNTFCCCGLALFGRLASILSYEGYLPVDASGDNVYKIFELTSLILCFAILSKMKNSLTTQNQEKYEHLKWYYLAPPALILAILIHPGLNGYSPLDIMWTFGMYLESFALLPQIILFHKKDDIEDHTSNFVITQVASKMLILIFWVGSYRELNFNYNNRSTSLAPSISGYFVLAAQLIQIILSADFLYLYLKSWTSGIPMARLPH